MEEKVQTEIIGQGLLMTEGREVDNNPVPPSQKRVSALRCGINLQEPEQRGRSRTVKRAVSVSIGPSKRDKAVEITLLGEAVRIERVGTDGDMEKAARLFQELDGKVDAFGLGGADLGLQVAAKYYPLHSVKRIVRYVKNTPLVDGAGLKNTLENRAVSFLHQKAGGYIKQKRAFIALGSDRWGLTCSLLDGGYQCIFGDMMFTLGLPIPVRRERSVRALAGLIMPIAGRLPFQWVYPTGEKQEQRLPKWEKYYNWAGVIAGDFLLIKRHMPHKLPGKVIITNTTTEEDVAFLRDAGVKFLVTTTPVFAGRSFGTNMMEAALVAAAGKGRVLSYGELNQLIEQIRLEPQIQQLN